MKTLSVNITENDWNKYNFQSDLINFETLVEKIKNDFALQALRSCQMIAEKVGLSQLSMEDIDAEINQVRNAKNRS